MSVSNFEMPMPTLTSLAVPTQPRPRELAAACFECTIRGDFFDAADLAKGTMDDAPSMRLEWGHLHLVRGLLFGEWDGHEQAASIYQTLADELAPQDDEDLLALVDTKMPNTPLLKSMKRDNTAAGPATGWGVWAKATSGALAGRMYTKPAARAERGFATCWVPSPEAAPAESVATPVMSGVGSSGQLLGGQPKVDPVTSMGATRTSTIDANDIVRVSTGVRGGSPAAAAATRAADAPSMPLISVVASSVPSSESKTSPLTSTQEGADASLREPQHAVNSAGAGGGKSWLTVPNVSTVTRGDGSGATLDVPGTGASTAGMWLDVAHTASRATLRSGDDVHSALSSRRVSQGDKWAPLAKMKPFESSVVRRKMEAHRRAVDARTRQHQPEEEIVMRRCEPRSPGLLSSDSNTWLGTTMTSRGSPAAPPRDVLSDGTGQHTVTSEGVSMWGAISPRRRSGCGSFANARPAPLDHSYASSPFASAPDHFRSRSDTATDASDAVTAQCPTWGTMADEVVAAEARLISGLLQLNAKHCQQAGENLKQAWVFYQEYRAEVHGGRLPTPLQDDIKIGIGIITAAVVEFPDGLRKTLGSIAPLATIGDESDWLRQVHEGGGPRALHAAIALLVLHMRRPRVGVLKSDAALAATEFVEETLRALIERHPDAVVLHLLRSLQCRRVGDPEGALRATSAGREAWARQAEGLKAQQEQRGRRRETAGANDATSAGGLTQRTRGGGAGDPDGALLVLDATPPAITIVDADAHLTALKYEAAANLYKEVVGFSVATGRDTMYQARAGIRLAGAMTLMGLQKWPGAPWGHADEWILHCVAAPRCPREEEDVAAAVAARFAHYTEYRPLLPFWLMFVMGDLETLGAAQRAEIRTLLTRLATTNPCRPPKEDFMAFPEGKALWRLIMGAVLTHTDPAEAKRLWVENLNDRRLGNDSIAIAYSQLLLGEAEVQLEHRRELGVRMLVKGAQLAGDRSTALQMRYSVALQAIPWSYLDRLVPETWWELWVRTRPECSDVDATEEGGGGGPGELEEPVEWSQRMRQSPRGLGAKSMSVGSARWLGRLMSQRQRIKRTVERTLEDRKDKSEMGLGLSGCILDAMRGPVSSVGGSDSNDASTSGTGSGGGGDISFTDVREAESSEGSTDDVVVQTPTPTAMFLPKSSMLQRTNVNTRKKVSVQLPPDRRRSGGVATLLEQQRLPS